MLHKELSREILTPSELNRLIADYLYEANYEEALNAFASEASIENIQVEKNLLRRLMNKGFYGYILQQNITPSPISLRPTILAEIPQEVQKTSHQFETQLGALGLEVLEQNKELYILVKCQNEYEVLQYASSLKVLGNVQADVAKFHDNKLILVKNFTFQRLNLPGLEVSYEKAIERQGKPNFFEFKDTCYLNSYNGSPADILVFYNNVAMHTLKTQLTVQELLFTAKIDLSDIEPCSVVLSISEYKDEVYIATDLGIFKARFVDHSLDCVAVVAQTLPIDDFVLFEWFLPLECNSLRGIVSHHKYVAVILQDEVYIVNSNNGTINNKIILPDVVSYAADSSSFVFSNKSDLYFYGENAEFRLKIESNDIECVSVSSKYIIITHGSMIDIMDLE